MPACCSVLASPRHPASWGCLLATLKSRQQPVWLTEPSLAQLAGRKAGGQGKVWWVWAGWQDWAVRPVLTYLYTVIQVIQHCNSNRTTSGVQHWAGAAAELSRDIANIQLHLCSLSSTIGWKSYVRKLFEWFQDSNTRLYKVLRQQSVSLVEELLIHQLKLLSDKTCVSFQLLENLLVVIFGDLTVFSHHSSLGAAYCA